jgi:ABC-type antimicrobial peptide transport system permease subunit
MVALGAERPQVMGNVLREGLRYAVAGLVIGLPAAFAASRLLRTLLFGVRATDPATYVLMAVGMLLVVTAACLLPALRASRIDPALAIRQS